MARTPLAKQENFIFPILLFLGFFVVMLVLLAPRSTRIIPERPTQVAQAPTQPVAQPTPSDHLTLMMSGLETVLASDVRAGQRLYGTACSACHGLNGQGISGLGPTFVNNNFINALNDDELVEFISVGRPSNHRDNKTGIAMPAKGGNPSLTDKNLQDIVDYIRSLNGATVIDDMADQPQIVREIREFAPIDISGLSVTSANTQPTPEIETPVDVATPEVVVVPALPSDTQAARDYGWYCASCHGANGEGSPTVINSQLIGMPFDREAFLDTITKLPAFGEVPVHTYRGGYPELNDEQIHDLLDYVALIMETSSEVSTEPQQDIPTSTIDVVQAQQDYGWYCASCHGISGEGDPTVLNSVLIGIVIDEEALFTVFTTLPAFGEIPVHTYRGGYPELSDERLRDLLGYVRILASD